MDNVQKYNQLGSDYLAYAVHAKTAEQAARWHRLADAAYNVALAFTKPNPRETVQRLADEASNGEVRSFYQAVRF